ncbi:hypothetical protein MRGA423_21560 [Mycobacterium tuberculosis RGTB423]|nr:hypothetical protein MRGA423_21560 [Mycobacterium tuberculosis RGTB423]
MSLCRFGFQLDQSNLKLDQSNLTCKRISSIFNHGVKRLIHLKPRCVVRARKRWAWSTVALLLACKTAPASWTYPPL